MWIETAKRLPPTEEIKSVNGGKIGVSNIVWTTLKDGRVTLAIFEGGKWFDIRGKLIKTEVIAWRKFRKPEPFKGAK